MAADYIRYENQGATRNLPLDSRLVDAFRFLPELGLTMEVFSGGQPGKGSGLPRVGSVRHDHGNAADVFFSRNGHRLDWANPQDQQVFRDIVQRAKANGVTGFGAGPGYMQQGSMHVGYGTPGVWGAGGKGANAPAWLRAAYDGTPLGDAVAAAAPAAPRPSGAPQPSSPFADSIVASAAPAVPPLGPARTIADRPIASAAPGAPAPQQVFGDLIAPQAPVSFASIIDSFAQRRRAAEEEQQARQARLAALFAELPA